MTASNTSTASHKAFIAKKIHSFVGIVPLGVYVLMHFTRNLSSLAGADAFDKAVLDTWSKPVNYLWVALLVYLPLIFHSLYGLKLMAKMEKTNFFRFPNFENLRYLFQRLSGLGVLGFLFAHIFLTRVHVSAGWLYHPQLNPEGQATFAYFATHMLNLKQGTVIVYALGILATVYHLANGISTFCISWGITTGEKAIKKASIVSLVFGIALLVAGYAILAGFFLHGTDWHFVTPGGPMAPEGFLGKLTGH